MPARAEVEQLLQDGRLWQPGRASAAVVPRLPSGWPELDLLLGGGWPLGELTELLIAGSGIGELGLLMPALARLTRATEQPRWVTLVAPPHVPYAPALTQAGLDLARLLVVRSRTDIDTLWALEQALDSRSCGAVIGWSDTADATALRRLQLAAEASGAWVVLYRGLHLQALRSPAPLRICLQQTAGGQRLSLEILKRRGGGPAILDLRYR